MNTMMLMSQHILMLIIVACISLSEIKRVFADGDYVILHVHSIREPGTRGRAIFDLFKLENGKIVEHWDAVQDIPEKSANENGMF